MRSRSLPQPEDTRRSPARATVTLARAISIPTIDCPSVWSRHECLRAVRPRWLSARSTPARARVRLARASPPPPSTICRPACAPARRCLPGPAALHAAALCDFSGQAWLVREDVGRHNAVDKVVGAALAAGRLPATRRAARRERTRRVRDRAEGRRRRRRGLVAVGAPSTPRHRRRARRRLDARGLRSRRTLQRLRGRGSHRPLSSATWRPGL